MVDDKTKKIKDKLQTSLKPTVDNIDNLASTTINQLNSTESTIIIINGKIATTITDNKPSPSTENTVTQAVVIGNIINKV
jgi:hypothetical protein